MNKFLKVLLIVSLKQISFLLIFSYSNIIDKDSIDGKGIIIPLIVLLIIYIILYFLFLSKICQKLEIEKNTYDKYGLISWLLIGGIITFLLFTDSWLWNLLPKTDGLLSGVEYVLVPMFLGIYLVVLGILKLFISIIKRIHKKV